MADLTDVGAVVFDVFGTVVDWRSGVIAEGEALAAAQGLEVDWPAFADRWRREGYLEPIKRIVAGEAPFASVDDLLRRQLDQLAEQHGFAGVGAGVLDRFAGVWERLPPWPGARAGLERLQERHLIGTLSNGTFAQLTRMARHGGLRWDCIIATELFRSYKPDPRTYEGAARLLGLAPGQVMLVAAHPSDLAAASRSGLRTAYVPRPLEWGPGASGLEPLQSSVDVVAEDFTALARALGA